MICKNDVEAQPVQYVEFAKLCHIRIPSWKVFLEFQLKYFCQLIYLGKTSMEADRRLCLKLVLKENSV